MAVVLEVLARLRTGSAPAAAAFAGLGSDSPQVPDLPSSPLAQSAKSWSRPEAVESSCCLSWQVTLVSADPEAVAGKKLDRLTELAALPVCQTPARGEAAVLRSSKASLADAYQKAGNLAAGREPADADRGRLRRSPWSRTLR